MAEQIVPGLYRIEVPLPRNPLRSLNSYVIAGDPPLVVDTGLNRPECETVLAGALAELGIDPARADYFITHMHADHSGLVPKLAGPKSRVFASAADAAVINAFSGPGRDCHWEILGRLAVRHGFAPDDMSGALRRHPGRMYAPDRELAFTVVGEGDSIKVGEFTFQCVHTPGHSEGHLCLYEPGQGLFLSGDHILGDITPNISLWDEADDPLTDYLKSLDKVRQLPVRLVLPGHRSLVVSLPERVEELCAHHERRLAEVLDIVRGRRMSAYEVAARMTWDLTGGWDDFPLPQKWFATGEAVAHLRCLETRGQAVRRLEGDIVLWEG